MARWNANESLLTFRCNGRRQAARLNADVKTHLCQPGLFPHLRPFCLTSARSFQPLRRYSPERTPMRLPIRRYCCNSKSRSFNPRLLRTRLTSRSWRRNCRARWQPWNKPLRLQKRSSAEHSCFVLPRRSYPPSPYVSHWSSFSGDELGCSWGRRKALSGPSSEARCRGVKIMKETARYAKIVEWSEEDQCVVRSSPGHNK